MKELRIGIIGTGIIARSHLNEYKQLEGVRVVGACDIRKDVLEKFCGEFDIAYSYADYRELLRRDDLDAVDVCLHNNLHSPISVDVMKSGKDCYCEKPMAGSYKDAKAMYDAAGTLGRKLHIQLGFLYGGAACAAKKLIAAGRLGKIYHARSAGFRRRGRPFVDGYAEKEFNSRYWAGGGAMYDMGVYRISQILYLMGLPKLARVSGQIYQELDMDPGRRAESGFDVEELGVGFAKFDGGITMDIIESWAIHADGLGDSIIVGNKGGLRLNPVGYFTYMDDMTMSAGFEIEGDQYRYHQLDPDFGVMDSSLRHWVARLRGFENDVDTAKIALDTMLLSEGIYLSGKLGREVSAEEIAAMSESLAISRQDTPFGELCYTPYPFL
ncbi:MAG: Gfo/Idh/MocA family oxidoreductase [Clostridiales bacterium]|nr:Gfo/Idh/MocA family oxidoreductase [Clostridiales bacterium]